MAADGRLLLDTCTVIWLMTDPDAVPERSRNAVAAAKRVCVSAASAWEVSIKTAIGKLPPAGDLADLDRFFARVDRDLATERLAIGVEDSLLAGRLPPHHRDPFDRLLAAHALRHRLMIVSPDTAFDPYGVRRLWAK
ncbi:MAG: type II toxin-antitoxin system VapC family toxin [Alphaproteobacteria bacterium]|nr:type II toxin-antitoxin system VapC family toxin [Alphaproteobacteria bacterium]